jgi:hypothetical protein
MSEEINNNSPGRQEPDKQDLDKKKLESSNPIFQLEFNIIEIGDFGKLYISADREDWSIAKEYMISVLIDLDGELDRGVPYLPDGIIYIYFPILDLNLPNIERLNAVARLGADLCRQGQAVLIHCLLGLNRSALVLGVTLTYLGFTGKEALEIIKEKRPGALFNEVFAQYLASLPAHTETGEKPEVNEKL